jgi:hypothetical protein
MRIIALVKKQDVIEKILKHLGVWEVRPSPPPRMAKSRPLFTELHIDYSEAQVPPSDNGLYVDSVSPADVAA